MPEDSAYSAEEMIGDITNSTGALTLPDETKEETAHFVADLINELVWKVRVCQLIWRGNYAQK